MQKYIILCGASGTGKTSTRNSLVTYNPAKYVGVVQHTTRDRRRFEAQDTYIFDTEESFARVKSSLIGRCHFNGNYYGSEPIKEYDDRIGIIILNEEGVADFINWANERKDVLYRTVGVFRPLKESTATREYNRSEEIILEEYSIYAKCQYTFYNNFEAPLELVKNFNQLARSLEKEHASKEADAAFKAWCKESVGVR